MRMRRRTGFRSWNCTRADIPALAASLARRFRKLVRMRVAAAGAARSWNAAFIPSPRRYKLFAAMVDRRRIVRQWKHGTAKVLVTLVRAEGSSYRRPGAHLLIGADGEYAGTISGGCLETEVVRKAAWMVRQGAIVERYSTLFDDTAEIPFGLGCGGVVDLLLEPAATPECRALVDAMEASLGGSESRVVTWLPVSGNRLLRAVFSASGRSRFASQGLSAAEIAAANGD